MSSFPPLLVRHPVPPAQAALAAAIVTPVTLIGGPTSTTAIRSPAAEHERPDSVSLGSVTAASASLGSVTAASPILGSATAASAILGSVTPDSAR